ncbi:hypothetical protein [Bradyrhizobium sp. SZCCHNS3052]|uniref:hypothetical protein n=1 Tax=Bradyrhizobium sp. SZCCHNS3052 TaxID=3057321 RepID=UPI0029163D28|nr:hypothetical protein [Bradyrhizobium sp. SZCCHNS3052]
MSVDNSLRFASDVASGDQLSEDALELLAADQEGAADMIEADVPLVRTRQEMAKDALGLDREAGSAKTAFGTMVNCALCSRRTMVTGD